MFKLPTEVSKPLVLNPRRMVIFAQTKAGKTMACSRLPNHLIIDLEEGSSFYECTSIDVQKIVRDNKTNPVAVIKEIGKQMDDFYLANGKWPYDFVVVDTTSALEETARIYATHMYKSSPIGKQFTGTDVVSELPNGAGYDWLRRAFDELLKPIENRANVCTILLAHIKNASINKAGKDLTAVDVQLTGKLKSIVCAEADAIGKLYRSKDGKTMLSFVTDERDLASGARAEHLSQKEFVVLEVENPDFKEKNETRRFRDGWNEIFI